jgi:hypothetical protein
VVSTGAVRGVTEVLAVDVPPGQAALSQVTGLAGKIAIDAANAFPSRDEASVILTAAPLLR